jgi:transcriptional regulator with XRE-family HTH domain
MAVTAHDANRERHWTCARRLSQRRHDLGLTQNDVVDRLAAQGAVATNRTLSAMEHGQGVDVGRLPELAVALDCTVTYLLGLTEEPCNWAPDDHRVLPAAESAKDAQPVATTNGAVEGTHTSWILGPDIPERRNSRAISEPALLSDQRHA